MIKKMWIVFILWGLGALLSGISILPRLNWATATQLATQFGKQGPVLSAVVATSTMFILMSFFTLFLARQKRGPSRLAKLKNELASAYLSALDSSAFNPHVEDSR